jgi:malto-oligosyltrehalose trehalohydrolase
MKERHHRRLPFGAELTAPDRTRFRLWAPSQQAVSVVIEGGAEVAMQATGEGWFEAEHACGAGTRYRYRVVPPDGGDAVLVPDPASRAQAGDVHDPSLVVDPTAFAWRHGDWGGRAWCETVIYEIHVGLAGGFAGVERLLPELAALGITAVELMPIADFTGARNWGYDGVLPFAPDTSYGTPDELKSLIDAAHGLGLMMFLDVVYNHFGPDGNYLGLYADAFFRDDIQTPWGRAIDFRRREVRDFFSTNALYWIEEYRFDGLRLDATHSIVPQDWLGELAANVTAAVNRRHVHLVVEHEGNAAHLIGPHHGYDAQWNDDCHHVLHVLLTDEDDGYYVDFATDAADKLARCLSEGFIYQGQASVFRKGEPRGEPSKDLPPTAFVSFLQNHDQIGNRAFGERLSTLAEPAAVEAAFAMLMLAPQIPLIFMGEERASTTPFQFFTSFHDELADAVREGRRNEFGSARGFADPAVRDTIPDPNDIATFERSRIDFATALPDDHPGRVALARTRRLIALRRTHIVPRLDGTRSLGAEAVGPKAVVARWHMGDGTILTIATNLAAEPVEVPAYRFHLRGELVHATEPTEPTEPVKEGCLPGYTTWVMMEAATAHFVEPSPNGSA